MIPIVIIHEGNSPYLPYCLLQAKYFNPQSKVFLIGDRSTQHYHSFFVEHLLISDFFEEALQFNNIYQHHSVLPEKRQKFNIQRWFILKDFMHKKNFPYCFYIDSDVLLYTNLYKEYIERFKHYDLALSKATKKDKTMDIFSGHNAFLKLDLVNKFCNFIWVVYQYYDLQKIVKKYDNIGDMALLTEFYHEVINKSDMDNKYSVLILTKEDNHNIYDHSMNRSDGFETKEDGRKKIAFYKNIPYGQKIESRKEIRFNSLHFQGRAKTKIKSHYKGNKVILIYYLLINKIFNLLIKIKK